MADTAGVSGIDYPKWVGSIVVVLFVGAIAAILMVISISSGNNGNRSDMVRAIFTTATVNGLLCLLIAGMGFIIVRQNKAYTSFYVNVIIHAALSLSIIGAAVSAIRLNGVLPGPIPTDPSAPSAATGTTSDESKIALGLGSTGFALGVLACVGVGYIIYTK